MWLAVLPISFTLAQTDRTIVKNDEVQGSMNSMSAGEILPTDTTPTLSKRELRRERVAKRNLHYNILGGPSYTPDFGLLVGGSALMTFRMNPSDTTQRRSIVPMAIALMFKGGLNLMTKPQLTVSVSSVPSPTKIRLRTSMASDIAPTKTILAEKTPANTVTAAFR